MGSIQNFGNYILPLDRECYHPTGNIKKMTHPMGFILQMGSLCMHFLCTLRFYFM